MNIVKTLTNNSAIKQAFEIMSEYPIEERPYIFINYLNPTSTYYTHSIEGILDSQGDAVDNDGRPLNWVRIEDVYDGTRKTISTKKIIRLAISDEKIESRFS